jgi:N-acyl-D-amino-acid deacylase
VCKDSRYVHVLFILLSISASAWSRTYDIVITSGEIYDGSGRESYVADIAVKGDRITAIGQFDPDAAVVINAKRLVVTPGFIDIHTHALFTAQERTPSEIAGVDFNEIKAAKNYLFQGVTTVVSGNCGLGIPQVAEIFRAIRHTGAGVNVVELVGHGSVRQAVMGTADRDPTPEEMERMKALVAEAMRAGAVGMSTGLYYAPGSYAKTQEVVELAKVVHRYGGIYATHMRDEGTNLLDGIREAIQIGRQANVPVQISHLKVFGGHGEGRAQAATQLIEEAQAQGIKVRADQYPYLAGSTNLGPIVLNPWALAGGRIKMLNRFADPALTERIRKEVTERIEEVTGPEAIVIALFKAKKEWEGKSLRQISKIMNVDPTEAALRILRIDDPLVIIFAMKEDDVHHFMTKPYVATCSDGWNLPYGQGLPHPRNYGAFARKIRLYVLDEGVISMAHAVRAATSLPADMLGLADRGLIKEGLAADIAIFDPKAIRDLATYEKPHRYSQGIEYLLVNGTLTINKGQYTGGLAGRPLKRQ